MISIRPIGLRNETERETKSETEIEIGFVHQQAENLRKEARFAIAKKVRQLRLAHQHASASAANTASATESGGDGSENEGDGLGKDDLGEGGTRSAGATAAAATAALEASMPEYVLPYAIHLLAHHPDFPVNKVVWLTGEGLDGW